jgi:hypothetical protein
LILASALIASLAANAALAYRYDTATRTAEGLQKLDAARREDLDILMELIPAVSRDVGIEDIEAYLGTVYSGEPVGIAEDRACVGCVVVSWRSFRFAFGETGRLSKVSLAPQS